jgi:hypothetical protein
MKKFEVQDRISAHSSEGKGFFPYNSTQYMPITLIHKVGFKNHKIK